MASTEILTAIENQLPENTESSEFKETEKNEDSKLKLDENYFEQLFTEEMAFRNNPNSSHIKNIIEKQCQAVEYFSSIGEEQKAIKYKLLNNIFLNDSLVINTLEKSNNDNIEDNYDMNYNSNIIDILLKNKKMNIDKYEDIDDFDLNMNLNFNINNEKIEQEKNDILLNMDKNKNKNNIESINLINDEIESQKNNFKKNLNLKLQKKKSTNENKILQGIQNVFISSNTNITKEIKKEPEIKNDIDNNILTLDKKISPIKLGNFSEKETSSNDIKFSSNDNNINPLLNSSNNKKTTSEFEPLTPVNKFEKNKISEKRDISPISEEVNETNDFTLSNNDTTSNNKLDKIEENININSNSDNISISNLNSSSDIKSLKLNESNNKENILKNFRLDFNDLFEYIKEHQSKSKKIHIFCDDIKFIIENYINDFNQHLSKNVISKIIKKFSDIWEDMFKKYGEIYEIYEKEIKKINIDDTQNTEKINELNDMIDNINIEKENALNQNEEKYKSEIENNSQYFKANYNKIDNGILLLNEKFAYMITKRVFDMINNE